MNFTTVYFTLFWQYGFVNHALELLVLRNYGPDVWEDIKWVQMDFSITSWKIFYSHILIKYFFVFALMCTVYCIWKYVSVHIIGVLRYKFRWLKERCVWLSMCYNDTYKTLVWTLNKISANAILFLTLFLNDIQLMISIAQYIVIGQSLLPYAYFMNSEHEKSRITCHGWSHMRTNFSSCTNSSALFNFLHLFDMTF